MNMFDLRADIARVLPENGGGIMDIDDGVLDVIVARSAIPSGFFSSILLSSTWLTGRNPVRRSFGFMDLLTDYKATVKMGNTCQDEVGAGAFSRGKCFPRP